MSKFNKLFKTIMEDVYSYNIPNQLDGQTLTVNTKFSETPFKGPDATQNIPTSYYISHPEISIKEIESSDNCGLEFQYFAQGNFISIMSKLLMYAASSSEEDIDIINKILDDNKENIIPTELVIQLATIPSACKYFSLNPVSLIKKAEFQYTNDKVKDLLYVYGEMRLTYIDFILYITQFLVNDIDLQNSMINAKAEQYNILNRYPERVFPNLLDILKEYK